MSQVFLAYKKVDLAKAESLRKRLQTLGVQLFFDQDLEFGNYLSEINRQLRLAQVVIVLWTEASADPDNKNFVLSEAQHGYSRDILVAVTFNKEVLNRLPVPFNTYHASDLSDWIENGQSAKHLQWQQVLRAVGQLINRPLLELARAIDDGSVDAKREFLRRFPGDLFAAQFRKDVAAGLRAQLDDNLRAARDQVRARTKDHEKKLQAYRERFEEQLKDDQAICNVEVPRFERIAIDDVDELQNQIDEYEIASAALVRKAADAERTAVQLKQDLMAKASEDEAKIAALQNSVEDMRGQLASLDANAERLEVLNSRVADLESDLAAKTAVLDAKHSEIGALHKAIADERASKAALISDMNSVRGQLQIAHEIKASHDRLKGQVQALDEELTKKNAAIAAQSAEMVRLAAVAKQNQPQQPRPTGRRGLDPTSRWLIGTAAGLILAICAVAVHQFTGVPRWLTAEALPHLFGRQAASGAKTEVKAEVKTASRPDSRTVGAAPVQPPPVQVTDVRSKKDEPPATVASVAPPPDPKAASSSPPPVARQRTTDPMAAKDAAAPEAKHTTASKDTMDLAGKQAALGAPVATAPSAKPSSLPASSLQQRTAEFLKIYYETESTSLDRFMALMTKRYADNVEYFGENLTRNTILARHKRINTLWPQRKYVMQDDATKIDCDEGARSCTASGVVRYETSSPSNNKRAIGTATFEFLLSYPASSDGPIVLKEHGAGRGDRTELPLRPGPSNLD